MAGLHGSGALVTGSSSGIGAAIATAFARGGATVVVNSATSVEAGEQLAAELPDASYLQADVGDPADAARLVAATVERHGRLDIVVNNAGTTEVIAHHDLDAVTTEIWERILRVNVLGTSSGQPVQEDHRHVGATDVDRARRDVRPLQGAHGLAASVSH